MSIRLAVHVIMLKSKVTKSPVELNNPLKLFSSSYPRVVDLVSIQAWAVN